MNMNSFKVVGIVDSSILRVEPKWEIKMKNDSVYSGDRIKIRDFSGVGELGEMVFKRLQKLLLDSSVEVTFIAPELVDSKDATDSIVSCNVYVGKSSILYYFPELVHKD